MTGLRAAILLATVSAVVAAGLACQARTALLPAGDPPATPSPRPAAEPTRGAPSGRVVVATDPPAMRSANPGTATSAAGLQFHWPVFDGLTRLQRDGSLAPALAREWRTPDGRSWEFTLGEWRFHDGMPVTALDAAASLEYYRDPQHRLPAAILWTNVERVEALTPRTLRVSLRQVDPTFPRLVAAALVMPIERVRNDPDFFASPVGSGPFRYRLGDELRVAWTNAGPDWTTPRGPANVREVEVRYVPDTQQRAAAVRSGEVDIAYPLAPDTALQLREVATIAVDPGQSTVSFNLDTQTWPLRDLRVRQALNYAVDRDRILKSVFGGFGELDGQLIGREVPGYNPAVRPYAFDPARARELLLQAGYAPGITLPMTVTPTVFSGRELGEAVAADLRRVNVNVAITVREPAAYAAEALGTTAQRPGLWVQTLGWDSLGEPNAVWRWYSADVAVNAGRRWDDPVFDRLYRQARASLDDERRAELYQQAARYLHDQAPVLFLWRSGRPAAVHRATTWEPGLFADMWVSRLHKLGP